MYESSIAGCGACKAALVPAQFLLTNKEVRETLVAGAIKICETFKVEGGEKSVCTGAVTMMADQLLPAIAEGILSSDRVCDETLHLCASPKIKELDAKTYVDKQINDKPDFIKNNTFVDDLYKQIEQDPNPRETVRSI